ncbi:hypothetical protein [Clostridium sp.]|uniref:hypothetical protein n=1 Tax=Clostridium sp. TaxID=1506 RepID=UPI001A399E81|nr:hypothetical protein [Clostridium sp.]MBK5243379.1 hypothetical protein [Clostridium sp.]
MNIKTNKLAIIILTVFFGGILITIGLDIWTTTSTKIPAKIQIGDNAGEYNPEDIRGSYTFAEVGELFEIDVPVLFDAFNIPKDTVPTDIQTKDLEGLFENLEVEIGNESVQIFVALYKNLPVTLADSYLPNGAVKILLELDKLDEVQKTYFKSHQVDIVNITENSPEPLDKNNESSIAVSNEEENVVKGSTTFQQLLNAGISKKQIEEVLNEPMPPTNQIIRTYCTEKGVSFSAIKDQLNSLIE